jgi:hypothetical protein
MNKLEPSELVGAISTAKSHQLSSTDAGSGSRPSGTWVRLDRLAFRADLELVEITALHHDPTIRVTLSSGRMVTLKINPTHKVEQVMADILTDKWEMAAFASACLD